MPKRKRHWGLNILIILALVGCILAFMAHAKTWVKKEGDHYQILSGIFYENIRIGEMDSLVWVDKIPQLERKRGFSAWAIEKGLFKDSLYPDRKISVFVDNLRNRKIKMVYGDSLIIYMNYSDSLETDNLFDMLTEQKEVTSKQLNKEN
ncbi:MAG: hypothetical protein HKN89_01630 [Eudoraea sp.]|nr:hypothetical protein [Eudoraea sp.]